MVVQKVNTLCRYCKLSSLAYLYRLVASSQGFYFLLLCAHLALLVCYVCVCLMFCVYNLLHLLHIKYILKRLVDRHIEHCNYDFSMFGIISGIRNQVGLLFGPPCIGLSNKTYRIHTQALPTHPPAR